jgi:hypothetical protein
MSSPSREHLLGYLLGALERTELEQVEAELESNPQLRTELRRLEHSLGRVGLADEPEHFDPPVDLAARTCRLVATRREAVVVTRQSWSVATAGSRQDMTWVNLLTVASVLIAGAAIFFPALNHSLEQAQRATCQNNLRQIGFALHEYSERDPQHRFPQIERTGNRGFAGFYAPLLVSRQLILDSATFLCPSTANERRERSLHILTPEEIDALTGSALTQAQQTMGGDYGCNMGYTENGEHFAPENSGRSDYVLISDAPSDELPGRRSTNHGGDGQNLLYEDGHIKFIGTLPCPLVPDDPFYNLERRVGAGLNRTDHCIGASCDRP